MVARPRCVREGEFSKIRDGRGRKWRKKKASREKKILCVAVRFPPFARGARVIVTCGPAGGLPTDARRQFRVSRDRQASDPPRVNPVHASRAGLHTNRKRNGTRVGGSSEETGRVRTTIGRPVAPHSSGMGCEWNVKERFALQPFTLKGNRAGDSPLGRRFKYAPRASFSAHKQQRHAFLPKGCNCCAGRATLADVRQGTHRSFMSNKIVCAALRLNTHPHTFVRIAVQTASFGWSMEVE